MKTITIAGGGVAGLALGVGLTRRGVPVKLHDKGIYPRHRVCGEFICGVREETLEKLGLEDLFADALRHSSTAWFHDSKEVLYADLPYSALGVSRFKMDKCMSDAFEAAGGDLHVRSSLDLDSAASQAGVVWATGRKRERGQWFGLKVHCEDYALRGDLEVHLGQQAYVGASAVEDGRVNVCGLFRRVPGVRGRGIEVLYQYLDAAQLGYLKDKVRASHPDIASYCGVSHFSFSPGVRWGERMRHSDDFFGLGDQWGVIPPFTGNGMSIALETAALAIDPLCEYAQGDLSWNDAVAQFQSQAKRALKTRFRVANLIQPLLLSDQAQHILVGLASRKLLPFRRLFSLTHGSV